MSIISNIDPRDGWAAAVFRSGSLALQNVHLRTLANSCSQRSSPIQFFPSHHSSNPPIMMLTVWKSSSFSLFAFSSFSYGSLNYLHSFIPCFSQLSLLKWFSSFYHIYLLLVGFPPFSLSFWSAGFAENYSVAKSCYQRSSPVQFSSLLTKVIHVWRTS